MRYLLAIGALLCFGLAVLAFASIRSDIQLTIAAIGVIGGLTLLGLYSLLGKVRDLSDRIDQRR